MKRPCAKAYNTDAPMTRPADLERALQRSAAAEARFRGLLEAAPDSVVIVDQGGAIQMVNRQTEVVFGYPREELLGQPVEVLMPERFRARHLGHRVTYSNDPHTRPMGVGLELFGRRKDGSEFPVEISLSPMSSEDESVVISIIRDVTGRKETEQRLRAAAMDLARSNAELEQFAYVASHDLQEPLRMVAGYTQLRQLFQNLIANGIKFSRPDTPPHVHVSATREPKGWTFVISDNGIGIEAQYLDRIFVLFQRLHSRGEYPGTGIGLAICKKIIERHGGHIDVESEPGKGTTFLFTLPAQEERR